MLRIALIALVSMLASNAAFAQSWKEYTYPQYSVALSFPAEPKVETISYRTAEGASAEARVYSVTHDNAALRMTIVDLSDMQTEEKTVIDHAIETLSEEGEVKLDIPHRVGRVYGRQLSIAGKDGSHSSIALFYFQKRLYQIEGVSGAHGEDATAEAIRFQQSLNFTRGVANRTLLEPVFQVFGRAFGGSN